MFSNIEEMKNKVNVEWLYAFLQDDQDESEKGWMARLDAAEALAQLGDPRGLAYLRRMAQSPQKDIREIALEILDGLKEEPAESVAQPAYTDLPKSDNLFFIVNAKYPYVVAWSAFIGLYLLGVAILNSLAATFLQITQAWLPEWLSSIFPYLFLIIFGFLVFRFVVRMFVLPFMNKS